MATVELYGKPDCCLCDEAKRVLRRVQHEVPFELREIDISGDAALERAYGEQIPVVMVAGRKAFKFRVDEAELRRRLARQGAGA
jgi:glutaredoxin